MPIIYRQRTLSFSDAESDLENMAPAPTDADGSIVLSDLVRTGEASRLRRRGAMRLDHGYIPQTVQPQTISPNIIVVGSPSWESEPDEPQGGPFVRETFTRERGSRNNRSQRNRRAAGDDELAYTYTIFCGAEESDSGSEFEGSPFAPAVLPLYPPSSSSSLALFSQRKKQRSTGCGAVLHMSAAPRQRHGTWLAKDNASAAVISLDAEYFDKEVVSKIVRSACGCFREGVGCAVCGNPIGTRYRGCKTAGAGTATTHHKPSAPVRPEGPRYWRARNHRPNSGSYTYTFFPNAVSSSPSYAFPPSPIVLESRSAPAQETMADRDVDNYESEDTQPTYTNSMFDRVVTASPTPLSDLGDDDRNPYQDGFTAGAVIPYEPAYGQGLRYGDIASYDPDGEFILEPSSPDKTNDLMLFPER